MIYEAKQPQPPKLIETTQYDPCHRIDDFIAGAWKQLRVGVCATQTGLTKRSGCGRANNKNSRRNKGHLYLFCFFEYG